jgi:ribosomal protein L37AE/L43A
MRSEPKPPDWSYETETNKDGVGILRATKRPKGVIQKYVSIHRFKFCSKCGKTRDHNRNWHCMTCGNKFSPMEMKVSIL